MSASDLMFWFLYKDQNENVNNLMDLNSKVLWKQICKALH